MVQKESIKSSSVREKQNFPLYPSSCKCDLTRALEDVTKLGYGHILLGWFLNPVAGTLIRREGLGNTHMHTQEDSQEKIEAEITMMLPQN